MDVSTKQSPSRTWILTTCVASVLLVVIVLVVEPAGSSPLGTGGEVGDAEQGDTEITALDVTVEESTVTVEGGVTFGGIAAVVVTDHGSDRLAVAADALGYEIETARIGQPAGDLVFVYEVADLTASRAPEGIQYVWDFSLEGQTFHLLGNVSTVTTPSESRFVLAKNCRDAWGSDAPDLPVAPTGTLYICTVLTALDAAVDLDDATIAVTLPLAILEDELDRSVAGSVIQYTPVLGGIAAGPSPPAMHNLVDASLTVHPSLMTDIGYLMAPADEFRIGSATVGVALWSTSGEPVASLQAQLDDGTFRAVLRDVPSGEYTLRATACFGPNCDNASMPVQVGPGSS